MFKRQILYRRKKRIVKLNKQPKFMAHSNYDEIVVSDRGGNSDFLAGMIASGAQQKGLDAGSVLALCGNKGGFGSGVDINGLIGLVVVASLFGGNNGGGIFGGGNRNAAGEQMIIDTINRNGTEIGQIASTLRCSIGEVMTAVSQVASSICNVSNQVGLSAQQIINSVQQGNMSLVQQLCNCCCDIKSAIGNQTNLLQNAINSVAVGQERGFSSLGYASEKQTCAIEKAIAASTEAIIAGQRAAEMREMQREITERDRRIAAQESAINNYQQTQTFGAMITQATAPIAAGLQALQGDVDGIKCRLPRTEVIPATPEYVAINRSINVPYCGGFGYGFGPYAWQGNNGGWG